MPRISITIEDSPHAGEWDCEYEIRRDDVVLSDITHDGAAVRWVDVPEAVDACLCNAAATAYAEGHRDLAGEIADMKLDQRRDGD